MSGKNDNAEQAQNCGASFDHLTSPFIRNVDNRVLFQDRFVGAGMWFRRLTASAPTISALVELIRGKSTPAAVTPPQTPVRMEQGDRTGTGRHPGVGF